ncbi:glycosyl amidation-associated protein WbuZ [Paenibacillus sp. FSL H8-0034]|uniref:glycosyl amidation-associated protein WbuZ n=1 Tax=Paenibacillus sp. FSL H8-0034 TaxID=2954671 RepID=UPI0030FC10C9
MLKVRVIPTLLWKNVGLVKGVAFNSWRRVGTVLPAITVYNTREVDELILVDITATQEQREPDYDSITDFSSNCFVPLTVGGGITDIKHVKGLLRSGADKVSINTAAYLNPGLITEISQAFGSQCVVGSIDVKKHADGSYECYSHNGTVPTGLGIVEWAQRLESLGVGEILLTSIDKDGTMEGYDIELIQLITKNVKVPVIASGGAGSYDDFVEAVQDGKAAAVAAASIFHFTEQTPRASKTYMAKHGIPVRNSNVRKC